MMATTLLERAFREVARLPVAEQEALAAWILDELASERRWDKAWHDSAPLLEQLGEEALAKHRAGQTKPLDPQAL